MIEDQIVTVLTAYSGLTALVGKRIYPEQLPQNSKLPAIVYQRISGIPYTTNDGDSGLCKSRFQFDIYATTKASALAVKVQLKTRLSGYSDRTLTTPIHSCIKVGERSWKVPDVDKYRQTLDFRFEHEE